jgi:hypothetical protein
MSQIHFIGGEKGGVGKSLVARLLAQYCIDRSLPFVAFDTDRSHGALVRFYAGYTSPASVDEHDSLDRIVEAAAENPGQHVLVDLAAQTQEPIRRWAEGVGLAGLADEIGLSLTWWHVMDAGRDSVDLLGKLLEELPAGMKLVLVKNEVRGEKFDLLEASGHLARATEGGARVMTLRKLPESTMQKIDAFSTSFWAAVNYADRAATGLGLLERQRVKTWLQRAYAEIDRIGV